MKNKKEYSRLIEEYLMFLNIHCPNCLILDRIKSILLDSIDRQYPDIKKCALKIKQRFAICVMNVMCIY